MTSSTESKVSAGEGSRRGKRRRWVWVLAGVLALLVIVVALLPTVLSWGIARRIAVAKANEQVNGKVAIDAVSLGWFSGFKVSGISVDDAEGARVAEVKSVRVPASVPGLLGGTKRLGDVVVIGPVVDVVVYPGGETNLQRLMKPAEKKPTVWPLQLGFDLTGSIKVSEGRISVRGASEEEGLEIRDLSLSVVSKGLSEPVTIAGTGVVGSGGSLRVDGSVTPAVEGKVDPNAIKGDLKVSMDGVDLRGVSGVAGELGLPVVLAGMSGIDADVTVNGMDDVKGALSFKAPDLTASGGPLGAGIKTPAELNASFEKSGDEASFKGNFASEIARADASGTVSLAGTGLPKGNAEAEFELDLTALGGQPGAAAVLGEGVQIEGGKVTGNAALRTEGEFPQIQLIVEVADVRALRDGEEIALEPIRLNVIAADSATGPRVENLDFTSSFATARGVGDLRRFEFSLDADLTAGTRTAAQFLNLGGRAADGRFHLEATVSGDEGNARRVESSFALNDFVLSGMTAEAVRLPEATGTLTAMANLDEGMGLRDVTEVKAVVNSPVVGASFAATKLTPQKGGALPFAIEGGRLMLNADLGNVGEFARAAGLLAGDILMKGQAAVNVGVGAAEGAVRLEPIGVSCTNVDVASGEKHFRQPEFTFAAAMVVDPAARSMQVEDAKAVFSFGEMEIPSATVKDWGQLPAGVTCDVTGAVSLAELFAAAGDFAGLPEGSSVAGDAELELHVVSQETAKVNLAAVVNGLQVSGADVPAMEPQKVTLNVDAEANAGKQTAALKRVEVQSQFVNIKATGSYDDWSGQRLLKAQGTLEPDWGQIAPLAAALTGQPVQMTGKKASAFSVAASLKELTLAALLRNATAKADMTIERAEFMGVAVSDVKAPLNLANGSASLLLEAAVSGGRFTLPLRADATTDPATVYVQDDTPVLRNVKITEPMTDQALAKINPIFQNAVATSGTVGFKLNTFSIPLAEKGPELNNMEFKAQLSLNEAVLQSTGFLAQALSLAKMNRDDLVTLPDQTIVIELREGRLVQEPISFTAGGYTLTLGGSVGLDKTLDMALAIPVTSGMVPDKNVFELLKDETLTVPVKGTISAPQFGGDILRENLNRLMKNAASKLLQQQGGRLLEELLK